ncbi:hypothetical protein MTO96_003097 [Rhipicephalus appendiculatus]
MPLSAERVDAACEVTLNDSIERERRKMQVHVTAYTWGHQRNGRPGTEICGTPIISIGPRRKRQGLGALEAGRRRQSWKKCVTCAACDALIT